MRRMNGRSPPFVSVGLIFIICILAYNLWTISSVNDDLKSESEKLQAEVKLCGVKQDQYQKKAQLLQQNVYELTSLSAKLNQAIQDDKQLLQNSGNTAKSKEQQNAQLMDDIKKLQEQKVELNQQAEERDNKILQIQKEAQHVIEMKNEAEEIISERDEQIKKLQQQYEQTKSDLLMVQANSPSNSKSVPGPSKLPSYDNRTKSKSDSPKEANNQLPSPQSKNEGEEILAKQFDVQNVIHNPEALLSPNAEEDPQGPGGNLEFAGVIPKPNEHLASQDKEPSINILPLIEDGAQKRVIPLPPQNMDDNPDVAIDDDVKVLEDPADDQDEEGKEIQQDLEQPADEDVAAEDKDTKRNLDDVDYAVRLDQPAALKFGEHKERKREPQGIGANGVQRPIEDNYVHFERDEKPMDNAYDTNLSNKIRNIGRL